MKKVFDGGVGAAVAAMAMGALAGGGRMGLRNAKPAKLHTVRPHLFTPVAPYRPKKRKSKAHRKKAHEKARRKY